MRDRISPPSGQVNLLPNIGRQGFSALLTLPPAFAGTSAGRRAETAIRSLLSALPRDARLAVAAHPSVIQAVSDWRESEGLKIAFVPIDASVDHTLWAQDDFLAVTEGEVPVLVFPAGTKRPADRRVVETVAAELNLRTRRADFAFEGGNVLVGARTIVVGADVGEGVADEEITRWFSALSPGKQVKVIRSSGRLPPQQVRFRNGESGPFVEEVFGHTGVLQPLFHIDAFLSTAGLDADGREVLFVGCPRLASAAAGQGRLPLCDQSVAEAFDDVAADLRQSDAFRVVRNPLVILPFVEAGLKAWSRATVASRLGRVDGIEDVLAQMDGRNLRSIAVHRWRAATQNGCVPFLDGAARKVLLPTFAHGPRAFLAPAEALNRSLWQAQGFHAVELSDYAPVALANGSLHCLFKFLPSGSLPA